jgi:hypothetical protein
MFAPLLTPVQQTTLRNNGILAKLHKLILNKPNKPNKRDKPNKPDKPNRQDRPNKRDEPYRPNKPRDLDFKTVPGVAQPSTSHAQPAEG